MGKLAVLLLALALASADPSCTYKDPSSGAFFDLSPLRKALGVYAGHDAEFAYYMNVCGPFKGGGKCTDSGAAICQFDKNGLFTASLGAFGEGQKPRWGLIPHDWFVDEFLDPSVGVMQTFTNGDFCYSYGRRVTRTTRVQFICSERGGDKFTVSADELNCVWTIRLETPHACPRTVPFPCTYNDIWTGHMFDLAPLWKPFGSDYTGSDGNYKYSMNVCGPSNRGGLCSKSGAAVCQFNKDGQLVASLGAFVDYSPAWGMIDRDPSKGLKYSFSNGDVCYINGRVVTRTTNVQFVCAETRSDRFTVSEDPENCAHTLTLAAPEACIKTTPIPCQYKDPTTRASFDLSPLRKERAQGDYTGSDGYYKYSMNVCGVSNHGGWCTHSNAAVCQLDSSGNLVASFGSFNQSGSPTWSLIEPTNPGKGVMYTFTNGDLCWINGRMVVRTTKVYFVCSEWESDRFLVDLADIDGCIYAIKLPTPHACPKLPVPSTIG